MVGVTTVSDRRAAGLRLRDDVGISVSVAELVWRRWSDQSFGTQRRLSARADLSRFVQIAFGALALLVESTLRALSRTFGFTAHRRSTCREAEHEQNRDAHHGAREKCEQLFTAHRFAFLRAVFFAAVFAAFFGARGAAFAWRFATCRFARNSVAK